MTQKNVLNQEKDIQKKKHKIIIELEKLTIYQKYSMESHKGQAVSSQIEFKGRECLDSNPSRTEASFQHFQHNASLRSGRAEDASHLLKLELPL